MAQRSRTRRRLHAEPLESRLMLATLPVDFTETVVASGLSSATAIEFSPDGKLFVAEQGGTMEIWEDDTRLQANFFANTPLSTQTFSERGLLGVAFDPNYATNRFVYAYYTTTAADNHNRVSRFTADAAGELALAGSEDVIMELDAHSAGNHNGGALHFGLDGMLYIASGDNASGSNAQSLANRHGKMLRIDLAGDDFPSDPGQDYRIPADQPTTFAGISGTPIGVNRSIWAMGLRNPFTFAVQPGSGRIFINDVGQGTWEEINEGGPGVNFGWPGTEGDFDQTSFPNFTRPFYAYDHGGAQPNGCAITGGAFYNPSISQFPPEYADDYFFADFCGNRIWHIDLTTRAVTEFASSVPAPVDLRVDDAGNLYYLARGSNRVFRVSSTSEPPSIVDQPDSQTGSVGDPVTFTVVASGATPLTYQWQRAESGTDTFTDIAGANGTSFTLPSVQASDDGDQFRVVVTDPLSRSTTSAVAILTATSNLPPSATITITGGLREGNWDAGTAVSFSGTATDPEQGTLPASSFTWQVNYLSTIKGGDSDSDGLPGITRPFLSPDDIGQVTSSMFTPATTGPYTLTDVAHVITLTVTDAEGRTDVERLVINPNTSTLTVNTDPTGLEITVDGQPFTAPHTFESVVGFQRPIGTRVNQFLGGTTYEFVSWSDGGAAMHTIDTPVINTTYSADFEPGAFAVNVNFQDDGSPGFAGYFADIGLAFGDRGDGLFYGWDSDITADARNRNDAASPDERYDTLNHMQKTVDRTWEIAVPNGSYDVHVVAGDPSHADHVNNLALEGTVLIDPDGPDNFDEYNTEVTVTDGRLTIQPAAGASNAKLAFIEIAATVAAEPVTGRHIFYSGSAFDTNGLAVGPGDDAAIAPEKTALLPGQTATSANYTSYSRGINGIMIDVENLAGTPVAGDFTFRVGNDDNPNAWPELGVDPAINVRSLGDGVSRITLAWPDNTIEKHWLQITLQASPNTGLELDDVFYFGNAVGDATDSLTGTVVDASDELLARNNPHSAFDPAPIDDLYDYDRDRGVDVTDQLVARNNKTSVFDALQLITVPMTSSAFLESRGDHRDLLEQAISPSQHADVGTSIIPATAIAKDIAITDILLVDANNNPIPAPVVGAQAFIRAEWTTSNLSTSDEYVVRFWVDGDPLDSDTILGQMGENVAKFWYRGGWYSSPGDHVVTVTIDGANAVPDESDEGNNSLTTNFTPVMPTTLPQKFVTPLAGNQSTDWVIYDYVDVDPSAESVDYRGGSNTYDGHTAIDYAIANFQAMDAGFPVLAAADGTVVAVEDGHWDRYTEWLSPPPPVNLVVIDRGSGWTTTYLHFRMNSIVVSPGQDVVAGQRLGDVGSSGFSNGPHLHFKVTHHGAVVETSYAPNSYWQNPPAYTLDAPTGILDHGVTNITPTIEELAETISSVDEVGQIPGFEETLYAWGIFTSGNVNDELAVRWYRPNDVLWSSSSSTLPESFSWFWWYQPTDLPLIPDLGTWRVEWYVNDEIIGTHAFEVSNTGAPEIRVKRNSDFIIDGRTTPIEFGNVTTGSTSTQMFTVENHGYDELIVDGIQLPAGFSLVEPLSDVIPPGISDTFVVQLDGVTGGEKGGDVRILSNDGDENPFSFAVTGEVIGSTSVVMGRRIFYSGSAFDSNGTAVGPGDDDAIAPDKAALLPGEKATFRNYTSYTRGINGIMLDVENLFGTPTASDFMFRVGNDDNPDAWPDLGVDPAIDVRSLGDGVSRITLTWPDNTIDKQWLQVTVKATENTGLVADDVFYFGNAIGEAADSTTIAVVDATDELLPRNFPHSAFNPAEIDDLYDYSRDQLVDTTDQLIARNNKTSAFDALKLITVPDSPPTATRQLSIYREPVVVAMMPANEPSGAARIGSSPSSGPANRETPDSQTYAVLPTFVATQVSGVTFNTKPNARTSDRLFEDMGSQKQLNYVPRSSKRQERLAELKAMASRSPWLVDFSDDDKLDWVRDIVELLDGLDPAPFGLD